MRVAPRTASAVLTAAALLLAPSAAYATGGSDPGPGGGDGGGAVGRLSDPLLTGLAGPLQIAVGDERNDVYVAQGFGNTLTKLTKKSQRDYAVNGMDGIDEAGGVVFYTIRGEGEPGQQPTFSTLLRWGRDGNVRSWADLLYHETKTNPDKVNTYGFTSIPDDCAAQLPAELGPATYKGQVDTNAFGVLAAADGTAYIADAGANAVLAVTGKGKVRTLAVLPPQPTVITAAAAEGLGLPACAVGLTYRFEPVPTDVEMGTDGKLYVTTLPGGPESPVLGARGSVYRIDPASGAFERVATGFLGATNLAIGDDGTIYVSELFAGRIAEVGDDGSPVPVAEVPSPSGLEYADGKLYVSYDVFENGSVATVPLSDASSGTTPAV